MSTVGVLGANGYVGKAIYESFKRNDNVNVVAITRKNFHRYQKKKFDLLFNSAMPSKRYWAAQNPQDDYVETVEKTAMFYNTFLYKKFIQISSVSARCQLDTVYGRNKLASENLVDTGCNLIIRLGPMYSLGLKKGVLIDIIKNGTVYVNGESVYAFADLRFCAKEIVKQKEKTGTIEIGAKNGIALKKVALKLGKSVDFVGEIDNQLIKHPQSHYPDAGQVIDFLIVNQNKLMK
ncbi:hypothetical protein ACFL1A_00820 [Patescibacteria group bacterium]